MTTKIKTFSARRFLAAARDVRPDLDFIRSRHSGLTIRQAYRLLMDEDDYLVTTYVDAPRTASDLDAELSTAAGAAGQYGASRAQIDLIVALCTKRREFDRMGYSRLTSRDASRLIDDLRR